MTTRIQLRTRKTKYMTLYNRVCIICPAILRSDVKHYDALSSSWTHDEALVTLLFLQEACYSGTLSTIVP